MPIAPVNVDDYKGQALITFNYDDGQKNNFDVALPLHIEFNVAAGFAIIAERTFEPRSWTRYMEPWQVTEASRLGVEICSHSCTHPRMTEIDEAQLARELAESRKLLEGLVGTHQKNGVTSFCIPYSTTNDQINAAALGHYDVVRGKGNKFTSLFPTQKQQIAHSYSVDKTTPVEGIKKLIDTAVAEKAWLTLMLHGVVESKEYSYRPNDTDADMLKDILAYVRDYGREMLMPVNLGNIPAIRAKADQLGLPRKQQNQGARPLTDFL